MSTKEIGLAKVPSLPGRYTTYPQGPYTTGCVDVMIGKDKYGTLMRLYYPTSQSDIISNSAKDWTRYFLGEKYTEGLAKFYMPYLQSLYTSLANRLQRGILIPAIWGAKIADKKFPLVIFSHGLTGHRSIYSCICNEIASHGFIVAAVEHRDESACATFTLTAEGAQNWTLLKTIPSPADEFKIRERQIEIRAKECSRALDVFEKLNSGIKMVNELKSEFQVESLKGKVDLSNPIITGHSFGGGTTILTLAMDKRFKMGLSLDPWMFPLKDQSKKLALTINQPILFVLMEEFQDKMNLEALKFFQKKENEFYTLKNGIHHHQIDTAMLFSKDYVILQKSIECYTPSILPEVALTINNVLMMKFIYKNLGIQKDYIKSCDQFLDKYEKHVTNVAQGTARSMLGWITLEEKGTSWLSSLFQKH